MKCVLLITDLFVRNPPVQVSSENKPLIHAASFNYGTKWKVCISWKLCVVQVKTYTIASVCSLGSTGLVVLPVLLQEMADSERASERMIRVKINTIRTNTNTRVEVTVYTKPEQLWSWFVC